MELSNGTVKRKKMKGAYSREHYSKQLSFKML